MLTDISDAILKHLELVPELKTREPWAGDVEDLLKKPHGFPSAHLIYSEGRFGEKENLGIGQLQAPWTQRWTLILMTRNLRSRAQGGLEGYELLERIREHLTGFNTGGGYLWPLSESLIEASGGVLAYGLEFINDTETEG